MRHIARKLQTADLEVSVKNMQVVAVHVDIKLDFHLPPLQNILESFPDNTNALNVDRTRLEYTNTPGDCSAVIKSHGIITFKAANRDIICRTLADLYPRLYELRSESAIPHQGQNRPRQRKPQQKRKLQPKTNQQQQKRSKQQARKLQQQTNIRV